MSARATLDEWVGARAEELATQYEEVADGETPVLHCPTGLRRLDAAGLLELGVCTVVLGHEGDGKSSLGLQFVEGCAKAGFDVQAYWPEDPRRFVADRVLSKLVGQPATHIRRLKMSGKDQPARLAAAAKLASSWGKRVLVDDSRFESTQLIRLIRSRMTPKTRLVLVDYAQVLSSETEEKSVERVISQVVWDLNEVAKEFNIAVVLLSQVRTAVKERGSARYERWRAKNTGQVTEEAVEGYRPIAGDGQWAPSALGQKAKAVLSWFRPGAWLKMLGHSVEDNKGQILIVKNNFGVSQEVITLHWDGSTTTISDPRDK